MINTCCTYMFCDAIFRHAVISSFLEQHQKPTKAVCRSAAPIAAAPLIRAWAAHPPAYRLMPRASSITVSKNVSSGLVDLKLDIPNLTLHAAYRGRWRGVHRTTDKRPDSDPLLTPSCPPPDPLRSAEKGPL
eukprot:1185278-Prorocentrum_minimum.AAC.2